MMLRSNVVLPVPVMPRTIACMTRTRSGQYQGWP